MFNYIKNIRFRISDIFIASWLIFGGLICFEQNRFVSYSDANLLSFSQPFFLFVIYFIVMILSLSGYLYFEHRRDSFKSHIGILILFFILIIIQVENIFLSPNTINMTLLDVSGNTFDISASFNNQVKFIHFASFIFITTTLFIGVFIFPKRIKNIKAISLVVYLLYIFALVALIYSLVVDHYIYLLKVLTSQVEVPFPVKYLCPSGFFGNPNLYGMFLEVCFFVSIINYSISKRKFNLILSPIFFIHLLFTMCKAAILAIFFGLLLLFSIRIYQALKSKDKRKVILFSSLIFSIILIIVIFLILAISLNKKMSLIVDLASFVGRADVWNASLQIIGNLSFIHGGGRGIYHTLVTNSNYHFEIFNCPVSHNSFIAIIGEGGIIYLVPYLVLLGIAIYLIIKNLNQEKIIAPLGCSLFAYLLHSFFEDNFYLVIGMFVVLLIVLNIRTESQRQ